MRLLETIDGRTYNLTKEFGGDDQVPPYAILSHTWDADQEVIFEDIVKDNKSRYSKLHASLRLRLHSGKRGYNKLRFCAQQAVRDGFRYFWVDTCCINKKNTLELQTAINSMFCWYRDAAKCYVYLSDVSAASKSRAIDSASWQSAFRESRWFRRGWTLQELLAPASVEFYSKEGVHLGNRLDLKEVIHDITDIPLTALSGVPLDQFSVDEKLSWATERETTREEDEVYALLGIFDITLPFIYDEGYDRALRRLLEKIYAVPDEQETLKAQKSRSTIPFGRDSDFVTRASLSAVHRLCTKPGIHAALVGLGGVGKSQIAIEYAYQMLEERPDTWVFWVHAETQSRFKESYYAIAKKTKLNGWDDPQADILQLVSVWLRNEANGPWLMILDSADDVGVLFDDTPVSCATDGANQTPEKPPLSWFLPHNSNGSMLVTSRSREVACRLTGDASNIVEVGPMDYQDANTLLRKKLTGNARQDEADQLISLLGNMPLALTQAAAFINRTPRMSVARYLDDICGDDIYLLNKNVVDIRRDDQGSNSIMTTWQISFEYLRKRSPSAARLLSLMSFFDRQGIPASLLLRQYAEEGLGEADFDSDMYMLTSLCLVKQAGKASFEMHGLVQYSMRRWLEMQDELEHWKGTCIALICEDYAEQGRENWPIQQSLLPHALAALDILPVSADPSTLKCLNSLGLSLKMLGRYEEAKTELQKVVNAYESTFGTSDLATITSSINLASIYNDQQQWTEAEKRTKEVLQTSKETLGPDHMVTMTRMANLGTTYWQAGKLEQAQALDIQTLELRRINLGEDHLMTVDSKNNLAETYLCRRLYREAEALQLEVLEYHIRTDGELHPFTLTMQSNLAMTYKHQGRLSEAETLHKETLTKMTEVSGPDSPNTLSCMRSLAWTYEAQGRLKEAIELMGKCCETFDRVYTPDSGEMFGFRETLRSWSKELEQGCDEH
ncbi:hypothetical protein C7974DRAFT_320174 [Boeremia exigua]|uniref:uncharacterized protein n=1 Tax=Boeremia exigua TaxID=749465 RepID=UPI001E8E3090|nr:uncharacterized protein C7974DRAFT_320174 [Boeremia exigua]KAH6615308.1 hypothetical protein C7974DRAFT_320174 [Boeremia exigua]